ncbi:hypothetical protein ACIOGZ_08005 [Kitasatospora sp. NPDC088160]|uniref:hypothetical protein n=1 Tax=Kitasatospora sp. NPDC088160 TaxID=3364072 RepID=UPI0037FD3205
MTLHLTGLPANREVPRDGRGRPLVVPKTGGRPRGLTRTTTHIDCIEDKSALTAWGKRMTLLGASRQPSLLTGLQELDPAGREGRAALDAAAEAAVNIAGANDRRERGTHLHTLSEYVDRGEELPSRASAADLADMAAYKVATMAFDVVAVEQFVVIDELGTAGTADRILRYDGPGPDGRPIDGLVIGDLKTGSSMAYGALKAASQLAIYSRGELYDHAAFPVDQRDRKSFEAWKRTTFSPSAASAAYSPLPGVNQDWGVIIHLPAGQAHCTLYWADLRLGWEAARLALDIRGMRARRGALTEFPSAA